MEELCRSLVYLYMTCKVDNLVCLLCCGALVCDLYASYMSIVWWRFDGYVYDGTLIGHLYITCMDIYLVHVCELCARSIVCNMYGAVGELILLVILVFMRLVCWSSCMRHIY
jgi:hypothetical protein